MRRSAGNTGVEVDAVNPGGDGFGLGGIDGDGYIGRRRICRTWRVAIGAGAAVQSECRDKRHEQHDDESRADGSCSETRLDLRR